MAKLNVRGTELAMEVDEHRNVIPGTEQVFDCDTLLLSIGLIPENELSKKAVVPIDSRTSGAVVYENNETEVPGIFACGNVLQVHDLVDFVTEESIRAGQAAAEYVLGTDDKKAGAVFALTNGENVKYTVPMKARVDNIGKFLEVSFRVKKIFGQGSAVVVTQGDQQIARFKRPYMSSSKMEKIKIPKALIDKIDPAGEPLTVSAIEEVE